MGSKFSSILFFALLGVPLSAQNLARQPFRYITPQEGLSQSTVPANFQEVSPVSIPKTKLAHVMLNMLKNARDSILESGYEQKEAAKLYRKAYET